MSNEVTEASLAITVAEAFGRTPPQWAIEARKQELRDAGEPTMSVSEALNVKCAAAFRLVDAARLSEADAVVASSDAASSSRPDLHGRMTALMNDLTSLAESRLGYSAERSRLYAQSEALECREVAGSVDDAVRRLELRRDALMSRPMASTVTR
jgi:hypothetical protein